MKTLDQCEEADMLVIHVAFDHFGLISIKEKEFWVGTFLELIGQVKKELVKPLAVILHSYSSAEMKSLALKAARDMSAAGIAVFPSIPRAAMALSKFISYHAKRKD